MEVVGWPRIEVHLPEDAAPSPDDTARPLAEAQHWTPARVDLRAWLRRNAASLAELYEGAVRLVFAPFPGKVRFIALAVREIGNRLPDVISGMKTGPNLQYKNRLDQLTAVWKSSGLSTDGSILERIQSYASGVPASPELTIHPRVFREIASLIRDHVSTREKPQDKALRLFEAVAPENKQFREALVPIIQQWLKTTEWFMGKVHGSGKTDTECCGSDDLLQQFELFETMLGALVRGFFKTVDELDEILEDTNS